ncbi:hypothetical protein BC332_33005 [Capsicum chinense]|nr:hypothetical protein BC332_33005 [Capsicum chinense]
MKKLIGIVQITYVAALLLDLVLAKKLNLKLGILNEWFALCFSGVIEIVAIFKLLPFYVLFASLAPSRREGSLMSFLEPAMCFSLIFSGFWGVTLATFLGITPAEKGRKRGQSKRTRKYRRAALTEKRNLELRFSKLLGPQDGQVRRTIHTLGDILRACVLDYKGSWDDHLPLIDFSYNNSYHSSIQLALFKALYGRRCRSPISWFEVGESALIGPDVVFEALEKFQLI